MTQEIDVENMPLAELRALAMQEADEATQPTDQPRDDQGRFVTTEVTEEQSDEPEEPATVIYRKEIDLGDGSGVQVFQAHSLEELVDKLTTAQTNATRKIRELTQKLKATPTTDEPKELSADEEALLGLKLASEPRKTIKQILDEELATREATQKRIAEQQAAASAEFMAQHPDYVANPKNGQRLVNYLQTYKLDTTVENLERAYTDLKSGGLLEIKSDANADKGVTTATETDEATPRIEEPAARQTVVEPVQRRAASGLSARGRTAPPARTQELTESELYAMPLEQLRALADKQARG